MISSERGLIPLDISRSPPKSSLEFISISSFNDVLIEKIEDKRKRLMKSVINMIQRLLKLRLISRTAY
jgi:hypothetical protein